MSLLIHFNPITFNITKDGTRIAKVGVSLTDLPASSTTVTPTNSGGHFTVSGALTFSTANWMTPQTITITGVSDANNNDCLFDSLVLTASGGLVEVKTVSVPVTDATGLIPAFAGRRWVDENAVNNLTDAATLRAYLIATIFNGVGLPTNATPVSVVTGYTGLMHCVNTSQLTNFSTVDKIKFNYTDVQGYAWSYYSYHIHASSSNGKVVMSDGGHVIYPTTYDHDDIMFNELLALGYNIVYTAQPVAGDNTTANPNVTITVTITDNHNEILTKRLDRTGTCQMDLFLADKIMMLNYMAANFGYSEYITVGFSGGSIQATYLPALTDQVTKAFIFHGIVFRSLFDLAVGDYETGGTRSQIYSTGLRNWTMNNAVEPISRLMLGCSNGRKVIVIHSTSDSALNTASGQYNTVYKEFITPLGAKVSGTLKMYVDDTHPANTNHQFYLTDVQNYMLTEL